MIAGMKVPASNRGDVTVNSFGSGASVVVMGAVVVLGAAVVVGGDSSDDPDEHAAANNVITMAMRLRFDVGTLFPRTTSSSSVVIERRDGVTICTPSSCRESDGMAQPGVSLRCEEYRCSTKGSTRAESDPER